MQLQFASPVRRLSGPLVMPQSKTEADTEQPEVEIVQPEVQICETVYSVDSVTSLLVPPNEQSLMTSPHRDGNGSRNGSTGNGVTEFRSGSVPRHGTDNRRSVVRNGPPATGQRNAGPSGLHFRRLRRRQRRIW